MVGKQNTRFWWHGATGASSLPRAVSAEDVTSDTRCDRHESGRAGLSDPADRGKRSRHQTGRVHFTKHSRHSCVGTGAAVSRNSVFVCDEGQGCWSDLCPLRVCVCVCVCCRSDLERMCRQLGLDEQAVPLMLGQLGADHLGQVSCDHFLRAWIELRTEVDRLRRPPGQTTELADSRLPTAAADTPLGERRTRRSLVRNRTPMICLCNILITGLQHDTTWDSLSVLDHEIALKNIQTCIQTSNNHTTNMQTNIQTSNMRQEALRTQADSTHSTSTQIEMDINCAAANASSSSSLRTTRGPAAGARRSLDRPDGRSADPHAPPASGSV